MDQLSLIKSQDKDLYQLLLDDNAVLNLLPIPQGSFLREDKMAITVDAFYMAQFPVTQELYESVMGNNPANFQGKNNPVECVMWYDAIAFCEQLNKTLGYVPGFYSMYKNQEDKNNKSNFDKLKWTVNYHPNGKGFRLPTEAEWEYAAKGSIIAKKTVEYSGSQVLDHVGWYKKNNDYETKPAGLKFPNGFGLHDMSGNVWEWCWDWYGEYDKKALNNPTGAKSGPRRVGRGGSWIDFAARSRAADRDYWGPRLPQQRPWLPPGFRPVVGGLLIRPFPLSKKRNETPVNWLDLRAVAEQIEAIYKALSDITAQNKNIY